MNWNELSQERYELAIERIREIQDEKSVAQPYQEYFASCAKFILMIEEFREKVVSGAFANLSLEEHEKLNHALYEDILPEQYGTSYGNPAYAVEKLGTKYGKQLSFLYTELRGMIVYAVEKRYFDMLIHLELFLEIYHYFTDEGNDTYSNVKSAIKYFYHDYSDIIMSYRSRELFDPDMSFAQDIIMKEDLSKPEYLYLFGEYIGENELGISRFLNKLPQETIDSMARTYTEGFRMGFVLGNKDLSKKSIVNIRYSIGFERIVKAAIEQFAKMGLRVSLYRTAASSFNKRMNLKVGYYATSPNRQFDYDHRFDDGLYLDKALVAKKLVNLRIAYEELKENMDQFAGPALIEIFGETMFEPENKDECVELDEKQQALTVEYQRDSSILQNEYMSREEYSFTIIAYPIPEIGEQFEAIFADTVKVNTLDGEVYKKIQQHLIDALDKGEKVRIKGQGKNKTELVVALHQLENPDKQTNFENCLADVNIPVGEVFTSPQLTGTNGHFHVTEVFLNELQYKDLELVFENGMVKEYTCKNFDDEEENKRFVKENLLYHRETLPIGEFAIGTNTTAYQMGKTYGISHLLPILIAEKTGPHFAIGDTCYKMSEEVKVFNPDGKEIVAKDNECSILRKTDVNSAYYNCHTDITIPYDELGEITVICPDQQEIPLIQEGRFVLAGTEELNEAFQ